MATLHTSLQGKNKKASTNPKVDASKSKAKAISVTMPDEASLREMFDSPATGIKSILTSRYETLKVSLTTFRADDQLDELIKSTRALVTQPRHLLDFQDVYASSIYSLVEAVKTGVSPKMLSVLSTEMGMPKEGMAERLGLASSTVRNKTASSKLLSIDDSEKVIGMSRLIGQVQAMVNEAGNPDGFDAAAWLANWMEQGLPALGGRKPSEYMDTAVGQALVSQLLAQIRSGAYA